MAKKQINISLASYVLEQLSKEAEAQGRSTPDLATSYVELVMNLKGLLPAITPKKEEEVPSDIWAIIEKSISGIVLDDCELAILSEHFNKDANKITLLRNKNKDVSDVC